MDCPSFLPRYDRFLAELVDAREEAGLLKGKWRSVSACSIREYRRRVRRPPSRCYGADVVARALRKAPEDFRKRVIKGLGESASGARKDAVKRYAEGLLR